MQPHHVDVGGAIGFALLQDFAGFVDGGEQQAAKDFVVGEFSARFAHFRRYGLDQGCYFRVDMRGAVALFVFIPTGAGFLTIAAHFHQLVGDRQGAVIGIRGQTPLAAGSTNIEAREIADGEGTHRVAEINHHLVHLRGQAAIFQ